MRLAFLLWAALALCFVALGLYLRVADLDRPFGFWANVRPFAVRDVRGYHRAMGRLWCVYGGVLLLLGLPLLQGEDSPGILLSVLGVVVESIVLMAVYILKIEPKYRK